MTVALIIIGIAALVLACGGIFFFVKKTKAVRKNEEEESDTTSKKKMGENTKPSKPEVKEKPVKVEKTEAEKEEIKKKEVTRRIQRLSELGLNRSKDVNVNEVENGTEAIGIVYNEKSKVYMFNPVGNKLNPGDVVTVLDQSDTKRTVPVVLGNTFLADSDIVKPFKDILDIIYQTNETAPAKVVHEEKPVEPVEEVKEETPEVLEEPVIETPKFTVTFDNLGHGESIDPLTDLENMPDALPLLTEEGFEFEGWFMDSNFEHEAEFDVKLESDVTLYAKWNEIPKPVEVVEEVTEPEPQEDEPEDDDALEEAEETENESAGPAETTVVEFDEKEKKYHIIKTKRTYEAKLSMLAPETKGFYDQIRNKLMSFDVKHNQTKSAEKFKLKRETLAILKVSGKQAAIYLNLNPNDFVDSKYKGKDVSDKKAYESTPFLYKTRTERKTNWALELIDIWAEKNSLTVNSDYKDEKYAVNYPNMTDEELIKKGYLTRTEVISDVPPKGFVKFREIEVSKENEEKSE